MGATGWLCVCQHEGWEEWCVPETPAVLVVQDKPGGSPPACLAEKVSSGFNKSLASNTEVKSDRGGRQLPHLHTQKMKLKPVGLERNRALRIYSPPRDALPLENRRV